MSTNHLVREPLSIDGDLLWPICYDGKNTPRSQVNRRVLLAFLCFNYSLICILLLVQMDDLPLKYVQMHPLERQVVWIGRREYKNKKLWVLIRVRIRVLIVPQD